MFCGSTVGNTRSFGETFDLDKHEQGTEVKAITYSAMQIKVTAADPKAGVEQRVDIWTIIDI